MVSESIFTRLCQGATYRLVYVYQNEEILSIHEYRRNLCTHESHSSAHVIRILRCWFIKWLISTNRFMYQMTGDVIMRAKSIMFTRKRYILNNDVIYTKGGWYSVNMRFTYSVALKLNRRVVMPNLVLNDEMLCLIMI